MKLSQYARKEGISYRTALRWWQAGLIPGYQAATGTIIVTGQKSDQRKSQKSWLPSTHESLPMSIERISNGRPNDWKTTARPKATGWRWSSRKLVLGSMTSERAFLTLLEDQRITRIVVEHKDRATRFGFRYVEVLLRGQGRTLEVVNLTDTDREDVLYDLVSVMYSFAARLYGRRLAKRKTEAIVAQLKQEANDATGRATSAPQN